MRIALFTDTYLPQVNGVAKTLGRLVSHAMARGHEVAVVAPKGAGADLDRAPRLRIELPGIPVPRYPELRLPRTLNGRESEFTVGWSGRRFAERYGVPYVTSFHTDFPAYSAGYGLGFLRGAAWSWLRRFHDGARVTFCPSEFTRWQLREHGFHERIVIWSRGIDAELFTPERRSAEIRERLVPGAEQVVVFVGRFAPEKRLELLFEVYREVRERVGERVALLMVGDGPLKRRLERRAPAGVVFTGYKTGADLADAFAAGDLFLSTSDTETFGNTILEAMGPGSRASRPSWTPCSSCSMIRLGGRSSAPPPGPRPCSIDGRGYWTASWRNTPKYALVGRGRARLGSEFVSSIGGTPIVEAAVGVLLSRLR